MSNRFHNKWHRKNHHTYGNASNPDAAHDPIASPDQPFLGDFSLQGALCAVAPMSAYAIYAYSNFTGLCAFGGNRAIQAKAFSFPGAESIGLQVDSQNIAISAYAPNIGVNTYSLTHGTSTYGVGRGSYVGSHVKGIETVAGSIALEAYSPNKAISANGKLMGAEIYSNLRAISAYGTLIGAEIYGVGRALSAMSPNLGIEVYSNQRALSAYGSIVAGEFRSPNTGSLIYGGIRALSAYSGYTAAEIYGVGRALSAMSPNLGIEVYSNNRALSAYGTSIGLETASPQVALSAYSPKIAIRAYAPKYYQNYDGVRALDVRGYSYFDGDVEISGSLSANGYISRFDTYVVVTSATYIENKGTETALTVIQRGNIPIAHFYDDGNSALFIDGTPTAPGYVGINTATPNQRLTVVGNVSGYSDEVSFNTGRASGRWSFASGTSRATGNLSHAEGSATLASGTASHTEGDATTASNNGSHAEGINTTASGTASHAEGSTTTASGEVSHAEGAETIASGNFSHAAGYRSTASQPHSYIWSGDSTLGANVTTSLDRQYLIYAPSGVFIPRGMVGIGAGTDYVNTGFPLTVNGGISSKGLRLWDNSKIVLGYFPSSNDGGEIFYQPEALDLGSLIIQTIDNADSKIVLRQYDQAGPTNYNRLVVGSDGNIGIGTGTATTIDTFNTTLAVYGTLSSYNSYVGEKIYFGSSTTPDVNLYKSTTNTLKTDDNFIIGINGGKTTLQLTDTTANVGLTIGTDTNLYRSAADTLKTDDSFVVDGASTTINSTTITLGDANTDTVTINSGPVNFPSATTAADALILGGDANLFRNAPDTLRTSDSLIVDTNLTVSGNTNIAGPLITPAPITVNAATKTVSVTETSIIFTTTNCTVTLPNAATYSGRWLFFKVITANTVISNASNVVPLNSATAGTAILAATAGKWAWLQSDGTNWIIMSAN